MHVRKNVGGSPIFLSSIYVIFLGVCPKCVTPGLCMGGYLSYIFKFNCFDFY